MKALKLVNIEAIAIPAMADLFDRAFEREDGPTTTEVSIWLAGHLGNPDLGVYVVVDDEGGFHGLTVLVRYREPFAPPSMVLHYYVDSDEAARKALNDAIVDWMKSQEVDCIWALNQTGHSDEVHMRLFRSHVKGTVKGSIIEYEV